MFSDYLKDTFTVQRLGTVTGASKDVWADHLTGQKGMLQPLSNNEVNSLGVGSKAMKLFTTRIDIQEKDKVVIGSDKYEVHTVRDYNFGGQPHLSVIILKIK